MVWEAPWTAPLTQPRQTAAAVEFFGTVSSTLPHVDRASRPHCIAKALDCALVGVVQTMRVVQRAIGNSLLMRPLQKCVERKCLRKSALSQRISHIRPRLIHRRAMFVPVGEQGANP